MNTIILQKGLFATRPLNRQSGLTLVELMVSVTLGLFMMAALTSLLLSQTSARDEFDKASRQIENGRYAMQILHDDIELAGYYGQLFSLPTPSLTNPCNTAPTGSDLSLPILGYDSPVSGVVPSASSPSLPWPLTCLSAANYLRGDVLVIRRADTSLTTMAAAAGTANEVYMQTTGTQFLMNTGGNANTANFNLTTTTSAGTNSAGLRAYLVHIYFISPCSKMIANGSTCTATDDTIPTLKRLELSPSGSFILTPLVEGIQNMQLDYGIDSNGDGYPDSYITMPATATATDWSNVMAIRVNLLARNNDPSAGPPDLKTYTLGAAGSVGPFNDQYKRHAYSEVVRAVNLTGRRAQQ